MGERLEEFLLSLTTFSTDCSFTAVTDVWKCGKSVLVEFSSDVYIYVLKQMSSVKFGGTYLPGPPVLGYGDLPPALPSM